MAQVLVKITLILFHENFLKVFMNVKKVSGVDIFSDIAVNGSNYEDSVMWYNLFNTDQNLSL